MFEYFRSTGIAFAIFLYISYCTHYIDFAVFDTVSKKAEERVHGSDILN